MNELNNNEVSGFVKPLDFNAKEDFVLLSEIPSGGFNTLFRAKRGGRLYILKGLKQQHRADPLYKDLLKKEYDLMIGLNHPGIVRLYSMEEVPELGPCIVMEHVVGSTLDVWMNGTEDTASSDSRTTKIKSKPGFGKRRDVTLQILDAMDYFHGFGIVHRDLKPHNILVNDNDVVKIIDFGLSDSSDYIDFKEPAGTDGYLAPEMLKEGVVVDARADIYAFGVILRQLFPHRYRMVARRCTAENPERRYSGAQAVRRAIKGRRRAWITFAVMLAAAAVLTLSGIVQSVKKVTPEDILQAMETYSLRADIIDRQADAVFCTDSISCTEEAQQMLSIFTVRYLNVVYEVLADYPEWHVAERDAFEAEAAAIMEQRINKIGEKVRMMNLRPDPVFYQTDRGKELAERYVKVNERRHELANCYDDRTPPLI